MNKLARTGIKIHTKIYTKPILKSKPTGPNTSVRTAHTCVGYTYDCVQ